MSATRPKRRCCYRELAATRPDAFLPDLAMALNTRSLALAALGRREEARERFQDALTLRNSYGLLAEDIHPQTGALWGNFPQTYSMAGVILSAMRLSQSWEDRYWRASS